MGQVSLKRVIFLIICFLSTGLLLTLQPESRPSVKKQNLNSALQNINNWVPVGGNIPLSPEIVSALELDDYVSQSYSNKKDVVSLYIGFYLSGKKVGAAHDPLVCFPGQGWVLSDTTSGKFPIESELKSVINFSTMLATRGQEKTFLLYWFQAFDETNPDTVSQKISLLKSRLLGKGEDNAFVRFSMSLGDRTPEECQKIISAFIQDFYPVFIEYIHSSTLPGEKE